MKVVLIGAGSISFSRGQIVDILSNKSFNKNSNILSLVDIDKDNLENIYQLAIKIAEHFGSSIQIEAHTDYAPALPGANYVLLSIAVKRLQLWEQDFRIPLAYGFKHCLGENGGPGAMFHALRNFEIVLPICREMEIVCPDAILINFTNPEARILNAIQSLTKVKAYGLCHGVFGAFQKIEEYMGQKMECFDYSFAGMNHLYTLLKLVDKNSGEDLRDKLFVKALSDRNAPPLWKKMIELFGVFSYPSDDHIGEYLSFGTEYHPLKWKYGLESRVLNNDEDKLEYVDSTRNESERRKLRAIVGEYASGVRKLDDKMLAPSGEISVNIIDAIENNKTFISPTINVLNRDHLIENLPDFGVVEVPATVTSEGIIPQHVGKIPDALAAIIQTHFTIHKLLIEAYAEQSKSKLLQAILLDPVVDNIGNAEKMVDDMLKLQHSYLPVLK